MAPWATMLDPGPHFSGSHGPGILLTPLAVSPALRVLPHRQSDPCLWGQEDGAAGGATAGHSHIHMSRHVGKKGRQPQTPAVGARLILGTKEDKQAQKGSRTGAC